MALASGTKLGRYEIQSPLGAGGMGEVYCARDTQLGRHVALTEIYASFPDEWVLLDEPQTDPRLGVQAGKILAHSKNRDELYRQAIALRPRHFAVVYTATKPDENIYVL